MEDYGIWGKITPNANKNNLKHLLLIPCIIFITLILKDLSNTPLVRDWLYFILLEFFLQVYYNRIVKEDL